MTAKTPLTKMGEGSVIMESAAASGWEILEDSAHGSHELSSLTEGGACEGGGESSSSNAPLRHEETAAAPAPTPTDGVKYVQCKTEAGGTKTVPMHDAGTDVYYTRQGEAPQLAKILGAHLDDLMEPYYTVKLADGREKQTDNGHISLERR